MTELGDFRTVFKSESEGRVRNLECRPWNPCGSQDLPCRQRHLTTKPQTGLTEVRFRWPAFGFQRALVRLHGYADQILSLDELSHKEEETPKETQNHSRPSWAADTCATAKIQKSRKSSTRAGFSLARTSRAFPTTQPSSSELGNTAPWLKRVLLSRLMTVVAFERPCILMLWSCFVFATAI